MRGKFSRSTDIASGSSGKRNQPYTKLAEIYDRVMGHVDYCSWAKYISSIFEHFNVTCTNILEIGCGTGNLSVELFKIGYRVTGMDISMPMLAETAKNFRENGIPLRLFSSSMTSIPLSCQFDAVICIYDSINYSFQKLNYILKFMSDFAVFFIFNTKSNCLFQFGINTLKNMDWIITK